MVSCESHCSVLFESIECWKILDSPLSERNWKPLQRCIYRESSSHVKLIVTKPSCSCTRQELFEWNILAGHTGQCTQPCIGGDVVSIPGNVLWFFTFLWLPWHFPLGLPNAKNQAPYMYSTRIMQHHPGNTMSMKLQICIKRETEREREQGDRVLCYSYNRYTLNSYKMLLWLLPVSYMLSML